MQDAAGRGHSQFDRTNLYEKLYANHSYHSDPKITHALPMIAALLAPAFGGRAQSTRVLDVGCSHGAGVQHLWELGFRASGVDLAPTAVAMATRLRVPRQGSESCGAEGEACFKQGSAAAIPWPNASFDAILSTDVLEHVPVELVPTVVDEFTRVARAALFLVIALNPEGQKTNLGVLHETVEPADWWRSRFEGDGLWNCSTSTHVTSRMHRLYNTWLHCDRHARRRPG